MQYRQLSAIYGRRFAHIPSAIWSLLTYHNSPDISVALDSGEPKVHKMLAVAISNAAGVGGGVKLAPDAKIDDGKLDVAIIPPLPLWRLALVLLTAQLGRRSTAGDLAGVENINITAPRPPLVFLHREPLPGIPSHTQSI